GTLRIGTRTDGRGLDPHRNFVYYVSDPMVGTTQGLVDLNKDMSLAPGVAEEWEGSADMLKWTFRLRNGAEYHNGRTIDAESVKWNLERIMDPAVGHPFTRSATEDIERVEADGKGLVHIYLKTPSAIFPTNLIYYPVNLIAPDSVDQADTHPIGCGPFKFVSWKRYAKTELVRFENYFETGADGKALPYLDAIEAYPKKEDKVRLTALRAGEIDMIDNMSFFDVADFKRDSGAEYDVWSSPQVGLAHYNINAKPGSPFAMDAPNGKELRAAVAHAIDKEAVHQAVFNGLGEMMNQFYVSTSPWHMEGVENAKEYDPEKSRIILRKLNMENMPISVVSQDAYQYMRNGGEILHSLLLDAGFAATNEVLDNAALQEKYKDPKDTWGVDSTASSFRFDPDGWHARWIHSNAPDNKRRVGFVNARADKLIEEAKRTADVAKRKELYREVDGIVNDEAALIYHHAVPLTGASIKKIKGYEPQLTGGPSYHGGGIRTAYFDSMS
ncbi:MAG: ABC transporter substrate-binding protein, partial [Alphaproteobacteria bacterium]